MSERYAVRVVFLDGVERIDSRWESLEDALEEADDFAVMMASKGYSRRRNNIHVGVIDFEDPERGELGWDDLDDVRG